MSEKGDPMATYIEGVSAKFYRGIGAERQLIGPLTGMNFFVGPNNAGKSIVLDLVHEQLTSLANLPASKILESSIDYHRGKTSGPFELGIGITSATFQTSAERQLGDQYERYRNPDIFGQIDIITSEVSKKGVVWVGVNKEGNFDVPSDSLDIGKAAELGKKEWWQQLWIAITHQSGGGFTAHWVPETLRQLFQMLPMSIPKSYLIPAKRELSPKGSTFDDLTGKGLIEYLAELQNPGYNDQHKKETFEQINRFLQSVLDKPKVRLEVPTNQEHLLVHIDNKVLPLHALGTGIHEVVLIASFCTIHQQGLMCIEEPESNLHPILQRKLIRYLQEHTENQYFIATHSAAFIDLPGSSVFRVANDGAQTSVTSVIQKDDKRALCDELGYRASDILQANAVIWVEGPSDRIYVRHWIAGIDAELIEGVHYTIMFYGGSLISHLSTEDDVLSDFIKLQDLNRNLCIIIDSDKANADDALTPNAVRIVDELRSNQSLVWITAGREIENYVDPAMLHDAIKAVHPKIYGAPDKIGQFDNSFQFERKDGGLETKTNKVGVALKIVEAEANLTFLDLNERLTDLVKMIRRANGLSEIGDADP